MTALDRLADHIDALTKPAVHRTRYSYRDHRGTLISRENVVHVVSLLDQLAHTTCLETTGLNSGHAIPGSRPTARLEALDVLLAIDVECSQLLGIYGGKDRDTLKDTLRGLVGLATGLDRDGQDDVEGSASLWVSRARSVTGWADEPAWRPDNTCPNCERKRSLRVRAITAMEIHASCVGCGAAWTPETIGLLAEYVRWENGEHDEQLEETA